MVVVRLCSVPHQGPPHLPQVYTFPKDGVRPETQNPRGDAMAERVCDTADGPRLAVVTAAPDARGTVSAGRCHEGACPRLRVLSC